MCAIGLHDYIWIDHVDPDFLIESGFHVCIWISLLQMSFMCTPQITDNN